MNPPQSASLGHLLALPPGSAQEDAWAGFLAEHQDLLLHVARRLGGDRDAVMDRFTFVLDGLRQDGFRRLRAYDGKGPGPFTTWLIVVARRLCLDHHRTRYGRQQAEGHSSDADRLERKRLVDLVSDELALEGLAEQSQETADHTLVRIEALGALEAALGALDPEDRVLLRIRFEDGVSVPTMARSLGFDSPFALYRRLDRILKGLRDRLRARGIDDASV